MKLLFKVSVSHYYFYKIQRPLCANFYCDNELNKTSLG